MFEKIFKLLTARKKACPKCFAYKSRRGFSIGEVILSAFVLAVGIVAVIGLLSSSIKHSIDSRDEIIASQLAQEGVELVRNIRDNNYANSQTYDTGIGNCAGTRIDSSILTDGDPTLPCPPNSYALYFNSTTLKYGHSISDATKFSRKIIISDSANPAGKQVESRVWWGSTEPDTDTNTNACDVANKCVAAISTLTDWNN